MENEQNFQHPHTLSFLFLDRVFLNHSYQLSRWFSRLGFSGSWHQCLACMFCPGFGPHSHGGLVEYWFISCLWQGLHTWSGLKKRQFICWTGITEASLVVLTFLCQATILLAQLTALWLYRKQQLILFLRWDCSLRVSFRVFVFVICLGFWLHGTFPGMLLVIM